MSDLIYREDAINAIYHHFPNMSMESAGTVLYEVPTAEERMCCKWKEYEYIEDTYGNKKTIAWECPNCEEVVSCQYNYCPECGARMED